MKCNIKSKWKAIGDDVSCGFIRKLGNDCFEMVQMFYLPTLKGKKTCCTVLYTGCYLSEFSEEEKQDYLLSYAIEDKDIDDWTLAQIILEETICDRDNIIYGAASYEEAERFILDFIEN